MGISNSSVVKERGRVQSTNTSHDKNKFELSNYDIFIEGQKTVIY